VYRLVTAINTHMAPSGVLQGAGGGDGGLFAGVTARYLALVASRLPGDSPHGFSARRSARALVLASAESAWDYRQTVGGLPVFGPFWDRDAELPSAGGSEAKFVGGSVTSSAIAERDLSVQISGWMLMEAAYDVASGLVL
jgi:predicted alpha-1,6-mannanase (GH76 family)